MSAQETILGREEWGGQGWGWNRDWLSYGRYIHLHPVNPWICIPLRDEYI